MDINKSFPVEFHPAVEPRNTRIVAPMQRLIFLTVCLILFLYGAAYSLRADVDGVAAGVPKPERRNVIVQLFNWPFKEITKVLPDLKELGYSHVHVSPAQASNEHVWQWWGRYQPIDFSSIRGPLGNEDEFRKMNIEADKQGIKIIADVVLNHMIDVRDMKGEYRDFVTFDGNKVVSEKFPQFGPNDFHRRCHLNDNEITCWLDNSNADLKTESPHVREVAKNYLKELVALGVDGFRFDAAKHIEPSFFGAVLAAVPGTYAFGEVITSNPQALPQTAAIDFYDFPLVATMKTAFGPGEKLDLLKHPASKNKALPGTNAVTLVRNHDIDRGQVGDRWPHGRRLTRYVWRRMEGSPREAQRDRRYLGICLYLWTRGWSAVCVRRYAHQDKE